VVYIRWVSGYFPERNDHYSYIQMRNLTERMHYDWSELNIQEFEIISKYSAIERLITLYSLCKQNIERSLSEPCSISEFRIQECISTVAAFICFCIFNFVLVGTAFGESLPELHDSREWILYTWISLAIRVLRSSKILLALPHIFLFDLTD